MADDTVKKVIKKVLKKATAKKPAVKKASSKTAAVKKETIKKPRVKSTVAKSRSTKKASLPKEPSARVESALARSMSHPKIQGMIQNNLDHVSRVKKAVFVDSEIMPENYGSTSITLLARDPHWVHAYWEIASSSVDDVRAMIGDEVGRCVHVLRLYDVTFVDFNGTNANHWFDVVVGRDANNWYVNLWSDNVTYCADIGLRAPDGRFFTLARSNCVTTPREYISPRSELVWMDVQHAAAEGGAEGAPGVQPYVYAFEPGEKEEGLLPASVPAHGRRFKVFLTEADIRAYYSRLFPLLRKILKRRKSRGQQPIATDMEGDVMLEYLEDMDLPGYDYFKKMLLGASEETWMRGRKIRPTVEILGGASELVSSWGASERQKPQEGFFFELGTELIVYGRTEPNATVTWGDKVIPLREDGTFTLRMALPTDTHIPLDFKAVSFNKKHERSIITAAGRDKTEYGEISNVECEDAAA